ncbi:YIP1 family protein [Paracoccus pacificus]|uniref:YIP1 family protein n=1 Tax=Paracoccus pacificus TaxID=1463598 RepID=A0ABW4R3T4_9RHOB
MTGAPTIADIGRLMVLTVRDPAAAVRILRGLNLTMAARWTGYALVVVLSAMLSLIVVLTLPDTGDAQNPYQELGRHPVAVAITQGLVILLVAWLMTFAGRVFKGRGSFADGLLLVTWAEAILLSVQVIAWLAILILPGLGMVLTMALVPLFLWLMANMARELHGFSNLPMVFLGMIATAMVAGMALSVLAAALGIVPPMPIEG